MHLGRFLKLDISLDWSVGILMALLAMSFHSSVLKNFPESGNSYAIALGVLFAVLILLSIFVHELAHVFTGRHYGIEFRSIRFFIFGAGVGMTSQPSTPKAEFVMAIAGPVMSLTIAFVGYTIHPYISNGPLSALINNLSHLNMVLGIFNMIPMFPTDGGRCLRALVWHKTDSFYKGTLVASRVGKFGGYTLMTCGILMMFGISVPYFGVGMGGLWLGVIGWMISRWAEQELKVAKATQPEWRNW